ncbi:GntR family transcriptional regulator [Breoghania sp.]|uniref:GntR family transcriptional regulator n=1 Tax=Breoghania sp. TaxID=2065378 RepID=UPI0026319E28|nr:GntR family transcriptional regulator [Breoghania sp.]MDJ0933413.1 GntR family transcriptional regulator [Breoghania sp.]
MKQAAGILFSAIALDRNSTKSVSVQLYQKLREIILSGRLSAGQRLPATRTLAQDIGVSRITVIDAIDRLVAEGMLVSKVGSDTFVSDILERQRPHAVTMPAGAGKSAKARFSYTISHAEKDYAAHSWLPHEARAFVTALPALDAFPMAHWLRIAEHHFRGERSMVMGYGQPKGNQPLRRAVASHLSALKGGSMRSRSDLHNVGSTTCLFADRTLAPESPGPGLDGKSGSFRCA